MRRSLSLMLVLAAVPLASPAFGQPRGPGGPGMGMGRGLFVSPAGEPFRRSESMPQPLRAWFEQADKDHDGALTWPEFEADFVRYFAVLDADHDGEIAPAEVARYEQEILPEMQTRFSGGMGMRGAMGGRPGGGMGRGPGGGGRGGMGGGMRPGGGGRRGMANMAMLSGAARFGILPIAHPIMDADINFNRGVSLPEFTQAAARRFAMLNTENTGRLTLPQLMALRAQARGPAPDGRRRRGDAPPLGEDEDGDGPGTPPPPPGH